MRTNLSKSCKKWSVRLQKLQVRRGIRVQGFRFNLGDYTEMALGWGLKLF